MLRRDDGQSKPPRSGSSNTDPETTSDSRSHRIDPAQRFDDVLDSFPEAVRELAAMFEGSPTLQELWDQCADTERSFESLLLGAGAVSPEELARVYSQHYCIPLFQPGDVQAFQLDPELAQRLDMEWCMEYALVPLSDDGTILEIATASSESLSIQSHLEAITGRQVRFLFASLPDVEHLVRRLYPDCRVTLSGSSLQDVTVGRSTESAVGTSDDAAPLQCTAPYLHRLFKLALQREASEVHLEQFEAYCQCQLHVKGSTVSCDPPESSEIAAIRDELVELCELDPLEKEQARWNGECRVRFGRRVVQVAVAYEQTPAGGRFVFSFAGRDQTPRELDRVGFTAAQVTQLRERVRCGAGLTLICGDDLSAPLETAYAILNDLADGSLGIATCEHSAHYLLEGVQQLRLRPGDPRTAHEALQTISEQQPDVLLVTTLDSDEAWRECTAMAESGTRVIAAVTLEANRVLAHEAAAASPQEQLLQTACDLLIVQKSFERCCSHCARATTMNVQTLRASGVDEDWIQHNAMSSGELCVWRGNGCECCDGKGTLGTIAAFGIAENNSEYPKAEVQVRQRALQLLRDGLIRWEDYQSAFGADSENSG